MDDKAGNVEVSLFIVFSSPAFAVLAVSFDARKQVEQFTHGVVQCCYRLFTHGLRILFMR